jgi:hypothetical protein
MNPQRIVREEIAEESCFYPSWRQRQLYSDNRRLNGAETAQKRYWYNTEINYAAHRQPELIKNHILSSV